jgi:hypothetical protein
MLLTLYNAKKHANSLSELAALLGLDKKAGYREIMEQLAKDSQDELDRHYMPLPFDSEYNVIKIDDVLNVGKVVGVGDGYVFVADKPEGMVTGYLANETYKCDGEMLLTAIVDALTEGALNHAQIQGMLNYVKECRDVG